MPRPLPELLAPAGSLDAVRAAVANGADAVYLGAERFNARDDGAQLTMDDVGAACRLAHAHGVRVYLTFNILLKPAELADALAHLGACLDLGIDAAIVQDLGAVRLIRAVYPTLEVHGSTQMTAHDPAGARVLHDLGVERVVLARENTLDDIRTIRAAVPDLGLETFVHGALCIAYSGQCLMSGMISERSANRGACAQSCRKDYVLADARSGAELDRGYLISARDLGAWEHLPAIAEAGVGCLKVEGRKKKPEYVATVTRAYRGFLDRIAAGDASPPPTEAVQPLVQVFSRGFTGGMYGGRAGRDYITRDQPDHRGAVLGEVLHLEGAAVVVRVTAPLAPGDGVGFEHPSGTRAGSCGFGVAEVRTIRERRGRLVQAVTPSLRATALPEPGWTVVRSAEAALLAGARASYATLADAPPGRLPLHAAVRGAAGAPLTLVLRARGHAVEVASDVALAPASRHGLDGARLREQLGRLGTTRFALARLDDGALPPGLFLPVSALNDLRQRGVARLEALLDADAATRDAARTAAIRAAVEAPPRHAPTGDAAPAGGRLVAEVFALALAREAAEAGAHEVVLDLFLRHPTPPVSHVRALLDELGARGVATRLRTPTIVRPRERRVVDKWLALGTPLVSGHLGLVAELAASGRDVVADYAVNVFNAHAADLVFGLGARRLVPSVELTTAELGQLVAPWGGAGFEVFVHGRPEGMTVEHCVLSAAFDRVPTTCRDLCTRAHTHTELTDPAGYVFPVATDSACRNRLLHSRPVDATAYLPALWRAGLRSYRLVFNVPGDPVRSVTTAWRAAIDAVAAGHPPDSRHVRELLGGAFTRGHFARAV